MDIAARADTPEAQEIARMFQAEDDEVMKERLRKYGEQAASVADQAINLVQNPFPGLALHVAPYIRSYVREQAAAPAAAAPAVRPAAYQGPHPRWVASRTRTQANPAFRGTQNPVYIKKT